MPIIQPQEQIREEDFILMPETKHSPDTRIHPVRTHKGLNWYETHEALRKSGLFMPNPRQLIDLVLALERGRLYDHEGNKLSSERIRQIQDDLLAEREPYRGVHLDAYFAEVDDESRIFYDHRTLKDRLVPTRVEPLEKYINTTGFVDLKRFNRQGLPTRRSANQVYEQGENVYFWPPANDGVARFRTNSDGVMLYCGRDPRGSDGGLGVYACARKS